MGSERLAGDLVVVTPWYPHDDGPYDGVFVREAVAALGRPAGSTLVIHLAATPPDDVRPPRRERTREAEVLRIDVPVAPRTPRHEVARAARRALAEAAPPELARADVVHAHVGVPTAWAVLGSLGPEVRLVTTEHATFVPEVLRTPQTAAMYREVLARTSRHFAVTELEARRLRRHLPGARATVVAGGNPVSPERFAPASHRGAALDRWLYVGNLTPRKGVDRVLHGLRAWLDAHPGRPTQLRLVGDGPQRAELADLAERLGLADRVRFTGPASRDELPDVLAQADLLLHLSTHETFGLTVVEAAMTGLPVLVTACGGPEETLAHAAAEGLVRTVPVRHTPSALAAAVDALERSAPTADVAAVRSRLVARHGTARFAADLDRAYRGAPAHDPPPEDAAVVLGLSISPRSAPRVAAMLDLALAVGGRATLVTSRPGEADAADPRIHVVDLAPHEARTPVHALEDLLVRHAPGAALRATRTLSAAAARVEGPHRRAAARGVNALSSAIARHEVLATRLQDTTYRYVHTWLDPWRLARLVERRLLTAVLDGGRPDVVVLADEDALPLAWRLARHLPGTEVLVRPGDHALTTTIAAASARSGHPVPRLPADDGA